jgi:hypothetical protein
MQALPKFLDYRAGLAHRLQVQWLDELEGARRAKPYLDLALTHIDDRFDTGMRDALGADAASVLPLLERRDFTFMIEDPATIWHLGPKRYAQIQEKYKPLTRRPSKLAIDINIVERYQDVYPTKQQTGTELFQLVHQAARSFPRVALYFENSILPQDAELLPASAAYATRLERIGSRLVVESPLGVGVRWAGDATVNGRAWPVSDGATLWLPPGPQVIEASAVQPALRMTDFNGTLKSATALPNGLEFSYESDGRAIAALDRDPSTMMLDGEPVAIKPERVQLLPKGQHVVRISLP